MDDIKSGKKSINAKLEIYIMYQFNKLLLTLLTIGGVGFINYIVTDQLGTTQLYKDANQIRLGYCLVWSLIDYVIYLILLQWFKSFVSPNWLQIIVTILTILIAWIGTSLLAYPLHWVTYKFYDWITDHTKINKSLKTDDGDVWAATLDKANTDNTFIYLFTLDHEPISAGRLDRYSADEVTNFQINLLPFPNDKFERLKSYDAVQRKVSALKYRKKHKVYEYANFKQNFVAIIVLPKENS